MFAKLASEYLQGSEVCLRQLAATICMVREYSRIVCKKLHAKANLANICKTKHCAKIGKRIFANVPKHTIANLRKKSVQKLAS
jgi:hypothetical protein